MSDNMGMEPLATAGLEGVYPTLELWGNPHDPEGPHEVRWLTPEGWWLRRGGNDLQEGWREYRLRVPAVQVALQGITVCHMLGGDEHEVTDG